MLPPLLCWLPSPLDTDDGVLDGAAELLGDGVDVGVLVLLVESVLDEAVLLSAWAACSTNSPSATALAAATPPVAILIRVAKRFRVLMHPR